MDHLGLSTRPSCSSAMTRRLSPRAADRTSSVLVAWDPVSRRLARACAGARVGGELGASRAAHPGLSAFRSHAGRSPRPHTVPLLHAGEASRFRAHVLRRGSSGYVGTDTSSLALLRAMREVPPIGVDPCMSPAVRVASWPLVPLQRHPSPTECLHAPIEPSARQAGTDVPSGDAAGKGPEP